MSDSSPLPIFQERLHSDSDSSGIPPDGGDKELPVDASDEDERSDDDDRSDAETVATEELQRVLGTDTRHRTPTVASGATLRTPVSRPTNANSGGSVRAVLEVRYCETPDSPLAAQLHYKQQNETLECLVCMCMGLKDGETQLLDLEVEPFLSLRSRLGRKTFKPTLEMVRNEVARRDPEQRPKNWTKAKSVQWLMDNPISDSADISFLKKEVEAVKKLHTPAPTAQQDATTNKQWRSAVPFLRMMHCLLDGTIKNAYLRRFERLSQSQLDANKSVVREEKWYELIAKKWADPTFNPITQASDCHPDFKEPIPLDYEKVKDFAAPDASQVDARMGQMRSNLHQLMTRWEASGAGDCGLISAAPSTAPPVEHSPAENSPATTAPPAAEQVPETVVANRVADQRKWGYFKSHHYTTDNRSSFLFPGEPSYLLYYWDLLEQSGLLSTTIQRMGKKHGSSNAGVDLTDLDVTRSSRAASVASAASEARVIECIEKLMNVIESTHKEELDAQQKQFEQNAQLVERKAVLLRKNYLQERIDKLTREETQLKRKHARSADDNDYDDLMDVGEELKRARNELDSLK